ncbi:MAG: PRC-barrel domain-containing protein [Longimicrobiales bacterium]
MAMRSVNELESAMLVSVPLDVRGWNVRTTADDREVGSVHDVLVDERGDARYLDIDLGIFRRHVLLPIGQAVADDREDVLWVHALHRDSFRDIPAYDHDAAAMSTEFEQRLTTSYDRAATGRRYQRTEYGGSSGVGASGRVAAGTQDPTMLGTEQIRLRRLSELDEYDVTGDDPDPRGWELVDAAGETLGTVDDLVVDPQAMKARYLEVDLKHDIIGDEKADHILVPVGYARLQEDSRRVRVDALHTTDVRAVPRYADDFDESYEDRVDRHFTQGFPGESRYLHPRYDAERLYRTRVVERTRETRDAGHICEVRVRR